MKITQIEPMILGRSIFVRVRTDAGIDGIGECSPMNARLTGAHFQARAPSQKPPELPACFVTAASTLIFLIRDFFMTKLYVGNLPFSATEEAVRTLFAAHGTVEKVSLINDRDTGRPRGFGFIEMSNADASRAMQALNGKDMDGRALKINEAQDKPRGGGGGGGGRY